MTTTLRRAGALVGRGFTTTAGRAASMGVAAVVAAVLVGGAPALAAVDESCIERHQDAGESRAEAIAACVREATNAPVPTLRPTGATGPGGGLDTNSSPAGSSDDGTSVGLIIAAALGGAVVGAGIVLALRKRPPTSTNGYANAAPSAPVTSPTAFAAPPSAPSAPDRNGPLVATLVDLSDRMSSAALRAEIVAALSRAGVHALEPAQGDLFDANRMRGVGSAAAPDPSWVGRVAGTERAGFHDGATVLRLPEVIVYTAAG